MSNKIKVKCLVSIVETIEIDGDDCPTALGGVINRARETVMNRHKSSIWDSKVSNVSVVEIEKTEILYENDEILSEYQDYIENLAYLESSRLVAMNPPHKMTVTTPPYVDEEWKKRIEEISSNKIEEIRSSNESTS